jgi:hypothetical protein
MTPGDELNNAAKSYLRTLWPVALGWTATVITLTAGKVGLPISEGLALGAAGYILTAAPYVLARLLERVKGERWHHRLSRWAARWVLSVGMDTGQPVYRKP